MRNRMLAVGVALAGVAVFIALLNGNLFGIAPDFEDLTDGFRPVMQDDALATAKADVAALGAVSNEFGTAVIPQLSAALQMDAASFNGFMGQQFPAVAAGVAGLPDIVTEFTGVVGLLESQQENFEQADQIPTGNLPATTMPWILLAITLGALVVAYLMFRNAVSGSIWATAFGAAVVIGVLVLSFIPKAQAADDMNEALKPVYNTAMVQGSQGALQVVGAMGQEMQATMLPALAQQLSLSPDDLNAFLTNFPATAGALENLPAAMGRFTVMVTAFDEELTNYESITETALAPIAWTVLLAGIAIFLFGGYGFYAARKES
jgi:hypothetical protein